MRYTEIQKREFVQSWETTDLSRKQFSKSKSLCYASFLKWSKQYTSQREEQESFIKFEDKLGTGTKIYLPNGVVIETNQLLSMGLLNSLSNV